MQPDIFFIIAGSVLLTMLFIFYQRGKETLSVFPDISSVQVLFREKRVSGYSTKSWRTKMGGANNILEVILTNRELWIRPAILLVSTSKQLDLLHKVDLMYVHSVEVSGHMVRISLQSKDGTTRDIHLTMKQAELFNEVFKMLKLK